MATNPTAAARRSVRARDGYTHRGGRALDGAQGVWFSAPARVVREEVLRSPFFPGNVRGLDTRSCGWAVLVPDKRPGAWAQEHVEGRRRRLSAELKRLAGPGRALRAIWGEWRGGKMVGAKWQRGTPVKGMGDDLDRLALSAAFEAG